MALLKTAIKSSKRTAEELPADIHEQRTSNFSKKIIKLKTLSDLI
jgi:hypothetical protein